MHERRAARLGAYFAISNYGMMHLMRTEDAGSTVYLWQDTPMSEVCNLAGHLMENDEHESMFVEEAEGWFEQFKKLTVSETREQFRHACGRQWFEDILSVPDEQLDAMRGRRW